MSILLRSRARSKSVSTQCPSSFTRKLVGLISLWQNLGDTSCRTGVWDGKTGQNLSCAQCSGKAASKLTYAQCSGQCVYQSRAGRTMLLLYLVSY